MPRASHFADLWLIDSAYIGWLKKTSEVLVRCTYCCKDFDIVNMGEHTLKAMLKVKNIRVKNQQQILYLNILMLLPLLAE